MFSGIFVDSLILSPYMEQSKSELVWDIATGPSSYFTPNVLSELSYQNIKSRGLGIRIASVKKVSQDWAFIVEVNYSDTSIKAGRSQDSDYLSNDREDEFSRSFADIEGNGNRQQSFGIGMKSRLFGLRGHYVSMLFGRKETEVNLTATNGVQSIPEEYSGVELTGLNSTYNSCFASLYVGFSTEHVFGWGTVGANYEYYDVEFDAEADWNLRDDLAHPVSFAHFGSGKGESLTVGYTYQYGFNWDFYLNYIHSHTKIKNGYDQIFFTDGSSYITTLNQLKFESKQLQLGFRYIF